MDNEKCLHDPHMRPYVIATLAAKNFELIANDVGIQGREGVVIVKTTQAILVTHYPETVQPGAAANTVEQLGDYLIKVGY